ncbi:MAG: hypothetical protein Q4E09_06870, partial [Eubacteriales bacterium]|nr:hypothetical protein [Eubacteriales bacterium]
MEKTTRKFSQVLALLLAVVMIFSACGNGQKVEKVTTTDKEVATDAEVSETPAPTTEATTTVEETKAPAEEASTTAEATTEAPTEEETEAPTEKETTEAPTEEETEAPT